MNTSTLRVVLWDRKRHRLICCPMTTLQDVNALPPLIYTAEEDIALQDSGVFEFKSGIPVFVTNRSAPQSSPIRYWTLIHLTTRKPEYSYRTEYSISVKHWMAGRQMIQLYSSEATPAEMKRLRWILRDAKGPGTIPSTPLNHSQPPIHMCVSCLHGTYILVDHELRSAISFLFPVTSINLL